MLTKKKCCECGIKRYCIATVRHVDGVVDWVCRLCWVRLDYELYLKERVYEIRV